MLSLSNYLIKIPQIKFFFDEKYKRTIEEMAHVEFKSENDYYKIVKVKYSAFDILLALEDMDFVVNKKNEDVTIKILKI